MARVLLLSQCEGCDEWLTGNGFVPESALKATGHLIRVGEEGLEIGVGSGRVADRLTGTAAHRTLPRRCRYSGAVADREE